MLTIFSTTRTFTGLFDVIQQNALRSWTLLEPRPEIIIFGDDPGTREICDELGLIHVPDVETSDLGTPLVSDMFRRAQAMASNDVCCFVNADIMLLPDFLDAVATATRELEDFMVVGQRWDVDITTVLPLGPGWQAELHETAHTSGKLRSEIFVDYFVFPTGMFPELPPFAIGRSAYDNWLIWKAGSLGASVVDATEFVTVVHQNHDYSHAGGMKAVWEGPEAQRAQELIGHWSRYHAVAHARFMFTPEGAVVPARGRKYTLARPRRVASHLLRSARPLRRRIAYTKLVARQRLREGASWRPPSVMTTVMNALARRTYRYEPLQAVPGYTYGQVVAPRLHRLRFALWLLGRFFLFDTPLVVPWHRGLRLATWLGNDLNRCVFVSGAYEPNELSFLAAVLEPGSVMVDAGANEGLYSLLAGSIVGPAGRVVAVEPSPRERERLQRNIELNRAGNITTDARALGDGEGEGTLRLADPRSAGQNSFGNYVHGGVRQVDAVTVPITSLDTLVADVGLDRVDVLKADVEGAETAMLRGADHLLGVLRPIVMLEIQEASLQGQGSSTAELISVLEGHGYELAPFAPETGRPTIGASFSVGDLNCVAVPAERVQVLVETQAIDRRTGPASAAAPATGSGRPA